MKNDLFFVENNKLDLKYIKFDFFTKSLLEFLKKDSVINQDIFNLFIQDLIKAPDLINEILCFLYQNFSEIEIKSYISNKFNFLYLDNYFALKKFIDLNSNNKDINKNIYTNSYNL